MPPRKTQKSVVTEQLEVDLSPVLILNENYAGPGTPLVSLTDDSSKVQQKMMSVMDSQDVLQNVQRRSTSKNEMKTVKNVKIAKRQKTRK